LLIPFDNNSINVPMLQDICGWLTSGDFGGLLGVLRMYGMYWKNTKKKNNSNKQTTITTTTPTTTTATAAATPTTTTTTIAQATSCAKNVQVATQDN
jgi:hypothetical protein